MTSSRRPRVSVLIGAYNHGAFLPAAIDSVLSQGLAPDELEVIVVDDGSTDDTHARLAPYGEAINYIYQDNSGQAAAWNRGLRQSRGEIVAFLDADDTWYPGKVARVLAAFDSAPDVDVVSHYMTVIDDRGVGVGQTPDARSYEKGLGERYPLAAYLDGKPPLLPPTSAIAVRASCLMRLTPFPEHFRGGSRGPGGDLYLAYLLPFYARKFVFVEEALGAYRIHGLGLREGGVEHPTIQHTRATIETYRRFCTYVERAAEETGHDARLIRRKFEAVAREAEIQLSLLSRQRLRALRQAWSYRDPEFQGSFRKRAFRRVSLIFSVLLPRRVYVAGRIWYRKTRLFSLVHGRTTVLGGASVGASRRPHHSSKSPESAQDSGAGAEHASWRLATVVFVLAMAGAIVVWPPFLETWLSLDWRIGNMRGVARVAQIVLVSLALLALWQRERLHARLLRSFPSARELQLAVATVTLTLVATLTTAEVVCRTFDVPVRLRAPRADQVTAKFDPELGWAYLPNTSVVSTFGSEGRRIPSYFDEYGARIPTPGFHTDAKRPLALFIGDSFTMGHGVLCEESFVGRLQATPDLPYQVVNMGVQGYGTDQSLLQLKRHFPRLQPKLVVYTFIDDHVVRNSNHDRRLLQRDANVPGTKPLFGLRRDGTLFLRKRASRVEDESAPRIWALVQIGWNRVGPRPSVALTQALVHAMRAFTEAHGARFLLAYWRGQGPTPKPRLGIFDAMNVDMLDLGADAPPEWRSWTIPGDGHPDARAHARVARLFDKWLRQAHP